MRASAPLQAKACALRPAILRRAPARQRLPLSKDHTAGRMEGRRRRAHHAAVGGGRRREFGGQAAQGRARRRGLDLVGARSRAARALGAESRRQPTPTPSCLRRGAMIAERARLTAAARIT